jgi:hypothetical protein
VNSPAVTPHHAPNDAANTPTLVPPAPHAANDAANTPTLVPPPPRLPGDAATTPTQAPPAPHAPGDAASTPTLVPPPPRLPGDAATTPTLVPPPPRTTLPDGSQGPTNDGPTSDGPVSPGPAPLTRAQQRAAAAAERQRQQASAQTLTSALEETVTRARQENSELEQAFATNREELNRLGLRGQAFLDAAARHADGERVPLPPAAEPNRAQILQLLAERQANTAEREANYAERSRLQARIRELSTRGDLLALYASLRPRTPGDSPAALTCRAATTDVLGLTATAANPMTAEHIVPVSEIILMPGFASIRDTNRQLAILNHQINLVPLVRDANSSRGNLHWGMWQGWQQFASNPQHLTQLRAARNRLATQQDALVPQLQALINAAVAAQGG